MMMKMKHMEGHCMTAKRFRLWELSLKFLKPTPSLGKNIFSTCWKIYGAIDIVDLNLSDLRNNFTNIKSACTEETQIVFTAPEILQVSSICPERFYDEDVDEEETKFLEGYDLIPEAVDLLSSLGKFIS